MAKTLKGQKDIPADRLASTDEKGRRVYIHPADVVGRFKNGRVIIQAVLLITFLVLPWVRMGGQPAVLLDVVNRRFALFGVTFWAHDAPMVLFVLLTFVFGLLFMTAVWGRVWCGWACPQTVFIESVFRRIERWIEGDAVERRRLDEAPWCADKALKKSAKWFLFVVAALVVAHSFLAYFVGTEELARMVRLSPTQNWGTFLLMAFVTGVILFDFGWFREQFCIIMCPYGRFQSVLMDAKSMAVGYDEARGEPRKGSQDAVKGKQGDCVACGRCVQVCPTGIDIRRGMQQLECIACTACIDACDDIMVKVGKPKGLIRYMNPKLLPTKRGYAYGAVLMGLLSGLTYVLKTRRDISITVNRAQGSPYVKVDESRIANRFKFHIANQSFEKREFRLAPLPTDMEAKGARLSVVVAGGRDDQVEMFFVFPENTTSAGVRTQPVQWLDDRDQVVWSGEVSLVGPIR
jgi:cytochrome c oxidase accessory protein FixG